MNKPLTFEQVTQLEQRAPTPTRPFGDGARLREHLIATGAIVREGDGRAAPRPPLNVRVAVPLDDAGRAWAARRIRGLTRAEQRRDLELDAIGAAPVNE